MDIAPRFSRRMVYPESFIKEVTKTMRGNKKIRRLLKEGHIYSVQSCLKEARQAGLLKKWEVIFSEHLKSS